MQIIANADRWSLADGTLSIGATDGSGGIDFEPPPVVLDAEFASTTWVLDSIVEGQAVRTPVFGVDVTLEIDDVVGTLEGFGGCNGFVGEVVIAAPSMSVENLSHDLAACDPPVTEQEQLFFDVLRSATEFEVEGERLTLVAGDVSLIFRAS